MRVVSIRALVIALAAAGLAGPACAQAPTATHDGESAALRSLVWRPGADEAVRVDVARHRRAKEKEAASHRREAKGRKGRHEEGVEHARGGVEASNATHDIVVHKGDTIDSIADQLGTTPEAIMKANHLRRPRDLSVGRKLKVLTPKTYTVQPGDTLYSIHRRFDVPVDALKTINGLGSAARLKPGQKIDLPGAAPAPEAQPEQEAPPPEEKPATSRRQRGRARPSSRIQPSEAGSAFETPIPAPTQHGEPSQPIPYSAMSGGRSVAPAPAYQPPAYTPPPVPATPPQGVTPPATAVGPTDAQVAAAGKGRFIWPTQGTLLSGFGAKPGGQRNDGVDIAAPAGAPVLAAAAGDVVYAGSLVPGFGILVLVKHEDGWITAYAHLSKAEVKMRDHVAQGSEIGQVGESGGVDRPQLHFEVRYAPSPLERARPIDPALVLPITPAAAPPSGPSAPPPSPTSPPGPTTATPLPPLGAPH